MNNKDRMTDHQEQQACESNTDNIQTISPGSVGLAHNNRPTRRYSKTIGKTNIYKPHTFPQQTIKYTQLGTHTSNTLHKSVTTNNGEDICQTNRELNSGQKVSVNKVPLHKNAEKNSQGSDTHIRTKYGRIV